MKAGSCSMATGSALQQFDAFAPEAAERYFAAHAEVWDNIRSLHVPESAVEARDRQGDGRPNHRSPGRHRHRHRADDRIARPEASQAIGIDRSSEMLRLARVKLDSAGIADAACARRTCTRCRSPTAAPTAAILHQVLHYAQAPAAAIAEAARVLRPAGSLLVVDFAAHDREELRDRRRPSPARLCR